MLRLRSLSKDWKPIGVAFRRSSGWNGGKEISLESVPSSTLRRALAAIGIDSRDCVGRRELLERATTSLSPKMVQELLNDPFGSYAYGGSLLSDSEERSVELFSRCSPSVVHIHTSSSVPFSMDATQVPRGSGSGIYWDSMGHVVTNWHVIKDAERAMASFHDGRSLPARLVGVDAHHDLAVLHVEEGEEEKKKHPPIALGCSSGLRVGQKVYAIGNPYGLDQTLTSGLVSGLGRDIRSITGRTIRGVIQTDAAINPGNSGGPLLDSNGRLIGVNTLIYSPSGAWAGVGFAIPSDTVARIVAQIVRHGHVARAALGVIVASDAQTRALRLRGVLALAVASGSGAERAGVQDTRRDALGRIILGDLIVAVDGEEVQTVEDLVAKVESHDVGEMIALTVLRGKERVRLSVELMEKKD